MTGNKHIDKIVGFLRLMATSTDSQSSLCTELFFLALRPIGDIWTGQSICTAWTSCYFSNADIYDIVESFEKGEGHLNFIPLG
jgi:hypothetical protein